MADPIDDEIADLVSGEGEDEGAYDEEASGDDDTSPEEEKPKRSRGRVRKTGTRKKDKPKTVAELDVEELLPKGLPKPGQSLKSIGDMYAKYGVGDRPEFKIHLYRTYPKIGPGGIKFDGFYDSYDVPLTEEQIQADYGGGQYRVVVVGPHPSSPKIPKHYDSHPIALAGEPNWDRMPRAMAGKAEKKSSGDNPPPLPVMANTESPVLAQAALKMMQSVTESEREEKRRMEQRYEAKREAEAASGTSLAEAERRRADDLITAERERSKAEREYLEKRMSDIQQESAEKVRRIENELRSRPSTSQEIRELMPLLQQKDDGATRLMLEKILQKHSDEIAAINESHREFVRSLREGHAAEMASLRSAHDAALVSEREASKSREERIEERLRSEREERERDRTRHREALEDKDQSWKDRLSWQQQAEKQAFDSRFQAQQQSYESRIQLLQQELDKMRTDNYDLKMKVEEKGDVFSQIAKHQELGEILKRLGGGSSEPSAATSGGGIGLTGGNDGWKETLVEGAVERLPQIMEKLFGAGGEASKVQQPPQQQMQNYVEGQVVDTPQGRMEVVRNPADGKLALAPKDALDRHRKQVEAQAAAAGGGLLGPRSQSAPRRAQTSSPQRKRQQQRRKSRDVSAVPNLAEGLPKRRPPWEGGGDDELDDLLDDGPPPPPSPPVPRVAMHQPEPPAPTEPMELTGIERQALQLIAKEVHESVSHADEPEEFAAKMVGQYPEAILKQIVSGYTDRQIMQGIAQVQPNSAGATPAGRKFIVAAFGLLRRQLQ